MDDIIQVLVFLVTFIIFIASAIMKKKKKPGAKNSNFESLVESFFGVSAQNQPIKKEVQSEQEVSFFEDENKIKNKRVAKNSINTQFIEEGIDAIPDNNDGVKLGNQIDNETVEAEFDLREAVIYSEILNRKVF